VKIEKTSHIEMSKTGPPLLHEPLLSEQESESRENSKSTSNTNPDLLEQITYKSRNNIRTRLLVVLLLHILDTSSSIAISVYSYGGDWAKFWNLDFQCNYRLAIIDLALLAVCRTLLFCLIFVVYSRHMVPVATCGIFLASASSIWSLFKLYFVLTSTACNSAEGDPKDIRQQPLAVAQVAFGIFFSLSEIFANVWIRSEIRKKQALEHVLFHVSAYASAYTSMHGMPGTVMRTESDPSQQSNTAQLFGLSRKQSVWLFSGCVALLIRLPFSLSLPHFVSEIIGSLLDKDSASVKSNVIFFIIAGCVDAFLDFWCVFLFGYTQQRIIKNLRIDLFRSILNQEISFFDTTPTGEISSRLSSDCAEMANDLTWCRHAPRYRAHVHTRCLQSSLAHLPSFAPPTSLSVIPVLHAPASSHPFSSLLSPSLLSPRILCSHPRSCLLLFIHAHIAVQRACQQSPPRSEHTPSTLGGRLRRKRRERRTAPGSGAS
jgi:hypothetical protein